MTPAIEALKAEIAAHNVKIYTDMIEWFDRRAAWNRAQGHVERAESLDAKAAEWRAKLAAYKEARGI